ncbi:MAG: ribosome silencing factor [Deltaproteobacteria bacterium]|nr:ribosome silencing factor [Deltaproteobacteria bacterium]MBW2417118.1 ribosome silencing factor [Deltaproteobacteria bacterium]
MSELGRIEKAQLIVEAALERSAHDPLALDMRELTSYADTFILLTGNSDRQVRAIADNVSQKLKRAGEQPLGVEGLDEARWVLIDANDVIVHIFVSDLRGHFGLERLWSDAAEIELDLPEAGAASDAKDANGAEEVHGGSAG